VTVVCRNNAVLRMLEGFLSARPQEGLAVFDGVPLHLRTVQEIRREPWVDFGCTGASDSLHDLLPVVRSRSFLWMQPFRWGNPERIHLRARGMITRDALATHPWMAGLGCPELAFSLPPPAEPDWARLGESRSLRVIRAALAANRRPEVALFPVYGLGAENVMGLTHLLLRNVLLGARNAQERGLQSAILVLDLSADTQPQAIARLRQTLDQQQEGWSRHVCTEVDEDPDRVQARIDRLENNGLLLVHAGGYKPQPVFDHVLGQSKLPSLFEGAGTGSRAVTLGRPFLQASNLSFRARQLGRQPRASEICYPFLKGFSSPLPYRCQKVADSVLLLKPAPSLLGSFLLDCARGEETIYRYFAAMAEHYGNPQHDRLLLALGLLELLRHHEGLRGQGRIPRWVYDEITGTTEETEPGQPGQASQAGQAAAARPEIARG